MLFKGEIFSPSRFQLHDSQTLSRTQGLQTLSRKRSALGQRSPNGLRPEAVGGHRRGSPRWSRARGSVSPVGHTYMEAGTYPRPRPSPPIASNHPPVARKARPSATSRPPQPPALRDRDVRAQLCASAPRITTCYPPFCNSSGRVTTLSLGDSGALRK